MIFCVEDDSSIRELMVYTLNVSGFEAQGFDSAPPFFAALKSTTPQLVILDIMLPGTDGIAILKDLRRNAETSSVPVIMATAKGAEYDKVTGLDSGADDYIVKPFGMMEMISRVRAVLRRSDSGTAVKSLSLGGLELNLNEHTVTVDKKRVQLTLKEYELLRLFMENPGRVYTRDRLLSDVWGADYFGETRTVDVHIGTLRTKLGKYGANIETVRGVGYRMEVRA